MLSTKQSTGSDVSRMLDLCLMYKVWFGRVQAKRRELVKGVSISFSEFGSTAHTNLG